ncbi:MAG: class I SAM-dependent methyltransferase [Ignavibacteria bacterium]|jgi:2-polyprenyl-3-methyl-5-hydroxy-6-metoxy-1,4-benzoquinol methylase|nr:class I SAM-dependent methyltransferase [Ignavibacteria bacterium]
MRPCPLCGNNENKLKIKEAEFLVSECAACGFIYLVNPPEEKEIYEDYYKIEFTAKDYDGTSGPDYLNRIYDINTQRVKHLKSTINNFEDLKLLDIGCGSGLFLKSCGDAGIKGTGIDVSNNALTFARESFGLDVSGKSVNELIAENKKFDIITLWHVLEHFLNPVEELSKIRNLLNDDGLLFVEVPNFNSIKFRLSGYKWKGGNHPLYHRSFFTVKTLNETLKKAGFPEPQKLNFTYSLKENSFLYNLSKKLFVLLSADAFLNFKAEK